MDVSLVFATVIVIMLLIAWATGIRIINEYERGVVLRLGRLVRLKGPGPRVIVPFGIDRLIRVDLRTVTLEVPPQEAITLDNVSVNVLAVIYFQVVHPQSAVLKVQNYINATTQIAQSTLRSVLGQCSLHDLLAERTKLNASLQRVIDEQTEPWGVKVTAVEIKDVEMPESLQRAMARQAEAEREKLAKIIDAEGELASAEKLRDAAAMLSTAPGALQLRYMQTLSQIGEEQATVIVFPLPLEILQPFMDVQGRARTPSSPLASSSDEGPAQDSSLTTRLMPVLRSALRPSTPETTVPTEPSA